jgi:predicted ATP-binding protein involved in virulence
MKIHQLEVTNFKQFSSLSLDLHPQFTLLVGENGAGKTSILDALAIALSIWLAQEKPDSSLQNSSRNILPGEIHLRADQIGDRIQFREIKPVIIKAEGEFEDGKALAWERQIKINGSRTTNTGAKKALEHIKNIYKQDMEGLHPTCPILVYYGAGRAWLPSKESAIKSTPHPVAKRWSAYYDCFNERIRFGDITAWFNREVTAAGARGGQLRPGYEVVKLAILECIPDATDLWFDADRDELILQLQGKSQPISNLSAGQRMMFALVADIAIKIVTLNAHLLPADTLTAEDYPLPRILLNSSGVVLIDELDVHLHPRWQRQVATDLKRIFPRLQFVCTSHSAQVIGELNPEEIRLLTPQGIQQPRIAFGADSNWILDFIMPGQASSVNLEIKQLQDQVEEALDDFELDTARSYLTQLETRLGGATGETTRLHSTLETLAILQAEASDTDASDS